MAGILCQLPPARNSKTCVLFDAYNYAPGQFTQHFTGCYSKAGYFEDMPRTYSENINGIITVSESIANLYKSNFRWNAKLVRNAPNYVSVDTHPANAVSIRLVHHDGATRKRPLESIIQLVLLLNDRFSLTFILVPTDETYLSELKHLANHLTPRRITFLDVIHPALLPNVINWHDKEQSRLAFFEHILNSSAG